MTCIVGLKISILPHDLLGIVLLSPFHTLKDDFFTTVRGRVVWWRFVVLGNVSQPAPANSTLCLTNIFLLSLNNAICHNRFHLNPSSIYGIQIENDLLYRRIANQSYPAYYFCICLTFFLKTLTNNFFKGLFATIQTGVVIFGIPVDDNLLCRGIESQSSPAFNSWYFFRISFCPSFELCIFVVTVFTATVESSILCTDEL